MKASQTIEDLLAIVFDEGFGVGEDIVFQHQVENDPEVYTRYRARAVKEATTQLHSLIIEAVCPKEMVVSGNVWREYQKKYLTDDLAGYQLARHQTIHSISVLFGKGEKND